MKKKQTPQILRGAAKKNVLLFTVIALALCASAVVALAICTLQTNWRDSTSSWVVCTNWDSGCPNSATAAQINNGGTAQISADAPMAEACSLTLGLNAGDSGTVQVSPPHGDLTIDADIFVGKGGKGTLTQTFGTITSAAGSIASLTGSNGSVTVDGTGSTWAVSGEVDVAGTTSAAGGTGLLSVTNGGTVSAVSGVHVWNSGTLTGNGTVSVNSGSGTVTVDGTLAPNWTLSITGSLLLHNFAATQCNVTPDNLATIDADISGTATLNGRLLVTMTGNFTPDTTYTLLHAAGGLSGTTFSSVSINYPCESFKPEIQYDANNVKLYLRPAACCSQ